MLWIVGGGGREFEGDRENMGAAIVEDDVGFLGESGAEVD